MIRSLWAGARRFVGKDPVTSLWVGLGFGVFAVALVLSFVVDSAGAPSPSPSAVSTQSSGSSPSSDTRYPAPTTTVGPLELSVIPKEARARTDAGAAAFAEFYVSRINEAWTRPDPELLRPFGLPTCKSCASLTDLAEELQKSSYRYEEGPAEVLAKNPENSDPSRMFIQLSIRQNPEKIVDQSGKTIRQDKKKKFISQYEVVWRKNHWVIATIKQGPEVRGDS
ncbi:MAG: DUF6318 family protein [Actinomycetota bacterium]